MGNRKPVAPSLAATEKSEDHTIVFHTVLGRGQGFRKSKMALLARPPWLCASDCSQSLQQGPEAKL